MTIAPVAATLSSDVADTDAVQRTAVASEAQLEDGRDRVPERIRNEQRGSNRARCVSRLERTACREDEDHPADREGDADEVEPPKAGSHGFD